MKEHKIFNPATGELISTMKTDDSQTIRSKFELAQKAQLLWRDTSPKSRRQKMQRFVELIVQRSEAGAKAQSQETGKPISQCLGEIKATVERINFFIENFEGRMTPNRVHQDSQAALLEEIRFDPLGVIANISAWNYPYFVGSNVFVPALLTGNAVLYKPSEFASLTGEHIVKAIVDAGFDPDLMPLIIGDGSVGRELLELDVQGVFFTGSYQTGVKISEATASKMIRVQLELGGKDPVYVCEDVDVSTAAAGISDGCFYNAGQSCCAVERIYVHHKIYEEFCGRVQDFAQAIVAGNPLDKETYLGPLTRKEQIKVLERQIADATSKGARLLCGGKPMSQMAGHYFEPTVVVDANHQMEIMKEESFGPVIGIMKVDSDQQALELMNDTTYGLTAGVFSKDRLRAEKMMKDLHAGSVYWNCCDRVSPHLPWSGRKRSGIGLTLSTLGIDTFMNPKAYHWRG
jgi:acyl-CoA reductase-like NAD-dependent aldehyde dehydrogenase